MNREAWSGRFNERRMFERFDALPDSVLTAAVGTVRQLWNAGC